MLQERAMLSSLKVSSVMAEEKSILIFEAFVKQSYDDVPAGEHPICQSLWIWIKIFPWQ